MKLYEYARETETRGAYLYRELAEQTTEKGISRVFRMMASDEEQLLRRLESFRRHYPEISTMESDHLHRTAIVFDSLCDNGRCSRIASDLEAYQLAIAAKKKVVDGYLNAASCEKEPRLKQMLQWLAALESKELREIEQLFDFANAPNRSLEWGEFSNLDEFRNFGYYEDLRRGDLET